MWWFYCYNSARSVVTPYNSRKPSIHPLPDSSPYQPPNNHHYQSLIRLFQEPPAEQSQPAPSGCICGCRRAGGRRWRRPGWAASCGAGGGQPRHFPAASSRKLKSESMNALWLTSCEAGGGQNSVTFVTLGSGYVVKGRKATWGETSEGLAESCLSTKLGTTWENTLHFHFNLTSLSERSVSYVVKWTNSVLRWISSCH